MCIRDSDNIITNTKPVRVFRVSKQTIVFLIIFIGILALSQVIYVFLTQPLRDSLQSISFNSERGNIQTMLPGGVVSSNYEDKGSFHG